MTDLEMARVCGARELDVSAKDGRVVTSFIPADLAAFAAMVRQEERGRISDELSGALQSDLENGVKWLNANAASEFQGKYPRLSKALSDAIGCSQPPQDSDRGRRE